MQDSNVEVLQAVCQAHEHAWKIEFIENKGQGQIILLHGPPGVGKTYTVESFSEASGRPLIPLTIADIGLEDETIENKLAKWFSLAESWNAILLLDEADIFMERRSRADIQRNALVSVFLRQMEYFKGIFFLTTNRIGHIDDAFLSRVNIVIGYDPLSDEKRARIWNGFFNKLQKDMERWKQDGIKPIIQVSKYAKQYILYDEEIKALQWNGREIRNAFQTAISLARYRASKEKEDGNDDVVDVEVDHFRSVMRMSRSFRGYMDSISKLPEAERARRAYDRNDDYKHQDVP
ncbi:P-loop containing nucleoside triphosphate hydrolase protein [Viridothelium virens]|uniref:P-loop containing nucleoside triphosphate hydrolase protein n=1 Tax=Viridothelium virens TaxID=1048519 RepID=A0A6A6GW34_VIRVR|nr:P-loop containing nucleoside triphosphate hydrolase protein [Viridothelium virens]